MARGNSRADSEYRGTYGNPQLREARAFRVSSDEEKRLKERLKQERRNTPEYQAKLRKETADMREKALLRRQLFNGADLSNVGIALKKGSAFAEITDIDKFIGDQLDQIDEGRFDSFSIKIEPGDLLERRDAANQRTLNAFVKTDRDALKSKGVITVEVDPDDLPQGEWSDYEEDETPSREWERSGAASFRDSLMTEFYYATGHFLSDESLRAVSDAIFKKIESSGDEQHTEYHESRREDDDYYDRD